MRCALTLSGKGKHGGISESQLAEVEQKAVETAQAWETVATPFFEPALADAVEARLGSLADVAAVRVGGYEGAQRALFVLTNPDLVDAVVPADHVTLFQAHADFVNSQPLANILNNIGVEPASIGDVLIDGEDTAYLVVAAGVAKQVKRLLPKGLRVGIGGAVTVTELSEGSAVEGELQPMDVKRLDKRLHQHQ